MEKDYQSLVFERTVHTMAVGESWINTYSICVTEDLVKACNVSTNFIILRIRNITILVISMNLLG